MYGPADGHLLMFVFSIKLYAWENAFIRKILFVRNEQEMKMLRKIGIVTVRQAYTAQHIYAES